MTNRFDLKAPRPKKDGGTFWHRVGTMFADDNGGFSILFDSVPIPDKDGRLAVKAFVPREGDNRGQGGQGSQPRTGQQSGGSFNDDEIPF